MPLRKIFRCGLVLILPRNNGKISHMNRIIALVLIWAVVSCTPDASNTQEAYIENLEAKNNPLEQELRELKEQKDRTDAVDESKQTKSGGFFAIGSTEDEVIEVMGEPDSYLKTAPEAHKFFYGLSTVFFYQGKMISYDNLEGNLKAKVRK